MLDILLAHDKARSEFVMLEQDVHQVNALRECENGIRLCEFLQDGIAPELQASDSSSMNANGHVYHFVRNGFNVQRVAPLTRVGLEFGKFSRPIFRVLDAIDRDQGIAYDHNMMATLSL